MLNNVINLFYERKQQYKQTIIVFFLIFFFSKEIVVNDYEIVIIYCLLTFIVFNYFNLKNIISNIFIKIANDIKEEYKNLAYTLTLIEETIINILFVFNLTFYFMKKIHMLSYKYICNLNNNILKNMINFNLVLLNLSKLRIKINVENKKKLNLSFLTKAKGLIAFDLDKTFLSDNKQIKYCD